jgi:hypothetical protein
MAAANTALRHDTIVVRAYFIISFQHARNARTQGDDDDISSSSNIAR